MSDDGKCYAATPAATLEEQILNSNIAKSETEWWAHREITRLRADLTAVTEERDRLRKVFKEVQVTFDTTWSEADLLRVKNEELRRDIERLREALRRIDGMATTICMKDDAGYGIRAESVMLIYETARAALEGVKENKS